MKITYTPHIPKTNKNLFIIKFSYEHGDADSSTSYSSKFPITKEELPDLLTAIEKISDQIDEARSTGSSLSGDFEDLAKFKNHYIPVELDVHARHSMSNYYAGMAVEGIKYFDENGVEFDVKVN